MSVGIETESYNPRERIMKKVLLTTTALVMTAGVAASEVTFSGTAGIALVDDNGAHAAAAAAAGRSAALFDAMNAANDAYNTAAALAELDGATQAQIDAAGDAGQAFLDAEEAYFDNMDGEDGSDQAAAVAAARAAGADMQIVSYYDLDVGVTAESQTGVTFALGFDMGAGEKVDYDDDDMIEVQGATIGDADVSATYAGWTLTGDQNGIDNLFDDTQQEDMKISGSVGGATVAFAADLEANTNSYSLGYTMGDLTLGVTGTNNDDAGGNATGVSASYAMGDLTLSAAMSNESNDAEDDSSVGFTYKLDALTVAYTTIQPGKSAKFGDEWDASIKYTAGAMSASFATDEASATTLIAEYDLGGATAFAAMHDKDGENSDLTTVGINFAF
jgi:hypothetical protein